MAPPGAQVTNMRRISVVGSSGAGKSTFGQELARRLDVPFTELDAVHHLAGWTPIEPDEFTRRIVAITAEDSWVIDGNYAPVVRDGSVWERADTVIWLDLAKPTALWRVTRRTLHRAATGAELWNGNRERWSDVVSWDPERSMIRWVWTTHAQVRRRYECLSLDPAFGHLRFVRLTNRREIEEFLDAA
jgi:adenylate kinase family enzyme